MSPEAVKRWQQLQLQVGPISGGSVLRSVALLPSPKAGPILVVVPGGNREPSPEPFPDIDDEKRVLGGEDAGSIDPVDRSPAAVPDPSDPLALKIEATPSLDPLAPIFETRACGWIGWKESKRERKRRDPWICRQAWLYWEEPGGKKRSRYIPKAKLAAVEESVYGLKRPIYETLELLGGEK